MAESDVSQLGKEEDIGALTREEKRSLVNREELPPVLQEKEHRVASERKRKTYSGHLVEHLFLSLLQQSRKSQVQGQTYALAL